jgi:TolB protein
VASRLSGTLRCFALGCWLAALWAPAPGHAAGDQIYIPGYSAPGGTPPVWVSLSGFTGEARQVLELDLYVQGFGFTNADNAQYVLNGSNNGNLQGRALDRFNKNVLVAKAYTGSTLRRQAHAFADDFVQALGRKGIAQTKIAFKVEFGSGQNTYDEIYVADFDGYNAQAVTGDHVITAAPCWVPGRFALYYGSYKLGNSAIFSHDLTTGARKTIAWYGGSSISPAVSPDGHKVAMILSKDGWTDVYVADADGTNLKRLTHSPEDESSPCWSQPDGQWICFANRVKERRVLCKVPAAGGAPQRIATTGVLNPTEPDWSPDGKWIAFTAQMGGFEICVVPSAGGQVTELVAGEDPSWAPNSRTLAFYRRSTGRLSLLDVPTKQVKDVRRVSPGENSQPSWAR